MSRVIGPILLACAAALGCSTRSLPNEMAPTPRLDPPVETRPAQGAVMPKPPSPNDSIAARVNNDIITWKDVLETLKDIPYNQWREYDPEDTVRFYSLRLQEAGMIKSTPQKIIAQGTDWRSFKELKKELKA